jgi:7-keto-8-aminopelargonate synthetase-like enzyme
MSVKDVVEDRTIEQPGRREFLAKSLAGLMALKCASWGRLFAEEEPPLGQAPPPSGGWIMESAPGPETVINGKRVLYFGGTGYFALHGHPEVIEAGVAAFRKYGTHSATSRTGFGNTPVQLELERKIADFFGAEDSIHFVSGYLDNLFLVQALKDKVGAIFIDETSHFSIRDAVYSALKPVYTFKHRDPADLALQLKTRLKAGDIPLVMSDGIFPTFGVIAPVPAYVKALEPYGGYLCLDDSHAVGHLGPNGRGTYDYYGVKSDRCFFAGTMSKAFGGHGGFIPATKAFIDHIKATCGAYPGATPSPTPAMAASIKGLEIVAREPQRRERLRRNVARVKTGLKKLGYDMNDTPVPIVTWVLKSPEAMKKVQKELFDRGIAVALLKYVGAPEGGVLRASIFSEHTPEQIDRLLDEIKRIG